MKYLITGGAGFIGSHLARFFVSKNHEVVVLDNFSTGRRENLKGVPVEVIEGDIRDTAVLAKAVKGVDVVFHHAALCSVGRSIADPLSTNEVNITGTLNLLDACKQAKVKRLIFASSSSVYGDSETLIKHENLPTIPLSPYAVSKLTGEHYCRLYMQLFGLETIVLRYFNVFGPRQNPESEYAAVIPKFLMAIMQGKKLKIFGDGTQTRDFTYVDNIVAANSAAANSSHAVGNVINVACGEKWSLLELINQIESIMQCDVALDFQSKRSGDIKHSLAEIARARNLLGYVPVVGFEEGIKKTVSWFFAADQVLLAENPQAELVRASC